MTTPPDEASPAPRAPTVHIIDDDEAVLRGIGLLLRSVRIPTVGHLSGLAFLDALPAQDDVIGCVLTDLRMPGLDGIGLLRRLRERRFRRPVIVMTAHGDISTAVRAMKEGATDFIEKPFDEDILLAAIEAALRARPAAPAEPAPPEPEAARAAARIAALSPRERDVLALLVAGKPNKTIAHDLGLSPRTVEVHRARLMARLGVHSLAEAVRLALLAEHG
ncbi:Transcriptional regulatory protein FixJ [Rhodovastum atsumiense]|uniref:response regulator transcription factor n=1 Tax=Rhodovastum atsumiense TaxID=504468 RepID=UPI00193BB878|nr:response regulator [Rhodovastum atsumiense]CAH2602867.1 Transcriptional regulatory protein FixJ [Rhodovastum atsumiense]